MKKASAVGFRPEHRNIIKEISSHPLKSQPVKRQKCHKTSAAWLCVCLLHTDHEVRYAGEDDGRDGPQREDVRQDLGQEVHRQSVVTADGLVTDETQKTTP